MLTFILDGIKAKAQWSDLSETYYITHFSMSVAGVTLNQDDIKLTENGNKLLLKLEAKANHLGKEQRRGNATNTKARA
jgi:hypothetical protein